MSKRVNRHARRQEAIIDPETLLGAIRDAKAPRSRRTRRPLPALDGEPVLQEFLQGALLETAGLAALHGAPPTVVRGINAETRFLLTVTFEAVSRAHRRLYEDLLPRTDTDAAPEASASPAASPEASTPGDSPASRPAGRQEDRPVPPGEGHEDRP